MTSRTGRPLDPPTWDEARLEGDRKQSIAAFRDERMREPLEKYLEVFEIYRDAFDELYPSSFGGWQYIQGSETQDPLVGKI